MERLLVHADRLWGIQNEEEQGKEQYAGCCVQCKLFFAATVHGQHHLLQSCSWSSLISSEDELEIGYSSNQENVQKRDRIHKMKHQNKDILYYIAAHHEQVN